MSLVAGVAQCLGWAAQIAFMRSLHHHDDRTEADGGVEATAAATLISDEDEKRRRRECRANAAFVACFQSSHIFPVVTHLFQSSHIWGNLVSSLMLDDRLRDGAPAVPVIVDDGAVNISHVPDNIHDKDLSAIVGVYCGVYAPCDVVQPSDVWNLASPGMHGINRLLI